MLAHRCKSKSILRCAGLAVCWSLWFLLRYMAMACAEMAMPDVAYVLPAILKDSLF